jgi:hypothetical protein
VTCRVEHQRMWDVSALGILTPPPVSPFSRMDQGVSYPPCKPLSPWAAGEPGPVLVDVRDALSGGGAADPGAPRGRLQRADRARAQPRLVR